MSKRATFDVMLDRLEAQAAVIADVHVADELRGAAEDRRSRRRQQPFDAGGEIHVHVVGGVRAPDGRRCPRLRSSDRR